MSYHLTTPQHVYCFKPFAALLPDNSAFVNNVRQRFVTGTVVGIALQDRPFGRRSVMNRPS